MKWEWWWWWWWVFFNQKPYMHQYLWITWAEESMWLIILRFPYMREYVSKPCSWDQEVHALKWYDAAACSQILAPSDTGQIQNVSYSGCRATQDRTWTWCVHYMKWWVGTFLQPDFTSLHGVQFYPHRSIEKTRFLSQWSVYGPIQPKEYLLCACSTLNIFEWEGIFVGRNKSTYFLVCHARKGRAAVSAT